MNERFDQTCAGPAVMEVDRLLSEFYEAAMPQPWPRLNLPRAGATRQPAARFARRLMRFALAASVVLAFLGYWGLAGLFPAQSPLSELQPEVGPIGNNPFPVHRHNTPATSPHLAPVEHQRTPRGDEATLFEENTPGGQVITIIGPANSKGMR